MTERKSAANIRITPRSSPQNDQSWFAGLRKLIADCGSNKHDQATVAIIACISEGVNTLPRLRGVMKALGFDAKHFGLIVSTGKGSDPNRHYWNVDANGRYYLLG